MQQKMELVQVPEKFFGNFFEGDCYVLLFVSLRWRIIPHLSIKMIKRFHCYSGCIILWVIPTPSVLMHTQILHFCLSPDAEDEQLFKLQHPLLDRLRVQPGWTGCSCCVHHTAGWFLRLLSYSVQRGSAQRVGYVQGILQKWNNVSERCLYSEPLSEVYSTNGIFMFCLAIRKGALQAACGTLKPMRMIFRDCFMWKERKG